MSRTFAHGLFGVLLVPFAASAQVVIRHPLSQTSSTYVFGPAACSEIVTLQWTYGATTYPSATGGLKLWATAGDCDTKKGSADQGFDEVPVVVLTGLKQGNIPVTPSQLPGFTAGTDGGTSVACGAQNVEVKHKICGAYDYVPVGTTAATQQAAQSLTMIYDTKPPGIPKATQAAAEDSAARVSFQVADSDTTIVIATTRLLDGGFVSSKEASATSGSVYVENLTNDVTYAISLAARDSMNNTSAESDAVSVTPFQTDGFFAVVRKAGSTETGNVGCSVAGGALPLAALGLALARMLARRGGR